MSGISFLKNVANATYLQNTKVLFVVHGCSTYRTPVVSEIRNLIDKLPESCRVEDFCENKYEELSGNKERLRDVQEKCQNRLAQILSGTTNHCILELVDMEQLFVKGFFKLAKQHGYITIPVPVTKISSESKMADTGFPLYWAWFFKDCGLEIKESCSFERYDTVTDLTKYCFRLCLSNFPDFKTYMENHFKGSIEFDEVYPSGVPYNAGRRLHCTAFYGGPNGESKPKVRAYAESEAVKEAFNMVSTLNIRGFIVTPRTAGARVHLTRDQMNVWANDTEESSNEPGDRQSCSSSLPPGSKAHVTVGCASGVQAVQTGPDLVHILELKKCGKIVDERLLDEGLRLTYYGEGQCSAFFTKKNKYCLLIESIFTGGY